MREAVMVLAPDVRGEEIVERGDRAAPANAARHLQPFRVLIEHRVHDVNESLVAGEKSVTSGEEIAFEPALAEMFAENFHHAAIGRKIFVGVHELLHKFLRRDFVDASRRLEAVSSGPNTRKFLWARLAFMTSRRNFPRTRVASASAVPGIGDFDGIVAEIRR